MDERFETTTTPPRDDDSSPSTSPPSGSSRATHLWDDARRAAATLARAKPWRAELASAVRRSSGAAFAAVFTAPPGLCAEAQLSVEPSARVDVLERFAALFLPRVERALPMRALARATAGEAYAPLQVREHRALGRAFRRDVLRPAGIGDLVNAFCVGDGAVPLGWICVGVVGGADEALATWGAELGAVAREAGRTLSIALDLASACGASSTGIVELGVGSLTVRERQIATLIATGMSDLNVASRLGIAEETVGSHLRRIYSKLDVRSRAELTAVISGFAGRPVVLGQP